MPSVTLPRPFDAYKGSDAYIFVSYAHVDAGLVYPELVSLRRLGYRIWYDEGIDPGNEWPEEIALAIKGCSAFLVFITPHSVLSNNVRDEINFANKLNVPLYSVHLSETDIPAGLDLRLSSSQVFLKYIPGETPFMEQFSQALPASVRGEAVDVQEVNQPVILNKPPSQSKQPIQWGYLLGGATLVAVVLGLILLNPFKELNQAAAPTTAVSQVMQSTATAYVPFPTPTIAAPSPTQILPSPTPLPFAWTRINNGEFIRRDDITGVAVDPQDASVIYVGTTNAGLYKTTDSGVSWQIISSSQVNPHISYIAIDPRNHLTVYAVTQRGAYKSLDGGVNWLLITNRLPDIPGGSSTKIIIDPQNSLRLTLVYAANAYLSEDGGNNWQVAYEGGCPVMNNTLVIDPLDSSTWYAIQSANKGFDTDNAYYSAQAGAFCKDGIYKSKDGGKTWAIKNQIAIGKQVPNFLEIEKAEDGKVYLYAAPFLGDYTSSDPSQIPFATIESSTDGGDSWQYVNLYYCTALGHDYEGKVFANCSSLYWLSGGINRGPTGKSFNFPDLSMILMAFSSSNATTSVFAGGSVQISTDGGHNYQERTSGIGMACSQIFINPFNPGSMYLAASCTQSGYGYFSTNGGASWQWFKKQHRTPNYPYFNNFDFDPDGITVYANNALSSKNNSGEWLDQGEPSGEAQGYAVSNLMADPTQSAVIYILMTTDQNITTLLVSNNGGASWDTQNPIHLPVEGKAFNTSMYFDHNKGERIYTIFSDQVITSLDHGKSWTKCAAIPATGSTLTRLVIDPRDSSHVYLATMGQGVKVSTDGCQSWISLSTGLTNLDINTLAMDLKTPDVLYAGTDGGAFMSSDGGKTWGPISEGLLGNPIIYSLAINPGDHALFAATPYGIFKLTGK